MIDNYDVIVIGGGAAGLSGAIALARSRRTVLVVDAGDPRNAPAGHVHNFLTQDGTPPAELYQKGRRELTGYGGEVAEARVESITRDGDLFRVGLGGRLIEARRLLVTTGARDELPDLPGLAQRWGRDVLHCPYCHGWEVRGQRAGVLATSPAAVHQALLFRQLAGQVTVLTHRGPGLTAEQRGQFGDLGIAVVDGEVAAVESADDHLTGVRLADDAIVGLDALVVAPVCRARAELLAPLGLEPAEFRLGDTLMGTYVAAGPGGSTPVPGLFVAGNIADVQAQVISAAAAGLMAGAAINTDLIMTDAAAAAGAINHRRNRV